MRQFATCAGALPCCVLVFSRLVRGRIIAVTGRVGSFMPPSKQVTAPAPTFYPGSGVDTHVRGSRMTILQQLIATIHAVIRNKGGKPRHIDAATRLDSSLDLDSLDYAELVVRLHQSLRVDPFATGAAVDITTVGDLAALYESALSAAPAAPS
jgi:acyl carrier protein